MVRVRTKRKKVEDFYELVNNGKLPIFKGHLLNEEDLIIRTHILNCICKFETSWKKTEQQTAFIANAIHQLSELEKDKLIELTPFHLKIKKSARPFVRNVCMAFDARLSRNIPNTTIFSSTI